MIEEILSTVLKMFEKGSRLRRARREDRHAAMSAIYLACHKTDEYVQRTRFSGRSNERIEHDLAYLWERAAILAREFDANLGRKCAFKNQYWLNPESYDANEMRRLRLDLDRVRTEAFDLCVVDDEEYERRRLRRKDESSATVRKNEGKQKGEHPR
jgi:hypothetical protein